LLTAFVFNEMFGMFISSELVVHRDFVFSWGSLEIVLLTAAVLLLSSVLVSLTVKRLKLNEILRWRGG
jgi:hypothetical protein